MKSIVLKKSSREFKYKDSFVSLCVTGTRSGTPPVNDVISLPSVGVALKTLLVAEVGRVGPQ